MTKLRKAIANLSEADLKTLIEYAIDHAGNVHADMHEGTSSAGYNAADRKQEWKRFQMISALASIAGLWH